MAGYPAFFNRNQGTLCDLHPISFQHGLKNRDCGLSLAAFPSETDDRRRTQTAHGNQRMEIGIERQYNPAAIPGQREDIFVFRPLQPQLGNVPAFVSQITKEQ